jgi:hypothetical protein
MSTYHHPDWSAYVRAAGLGLDALHARYVSHVYDRHFHDFYVMGVVERGAATFALARRTITIPLRCAMLINPGEAHDGRPSGISASCARSCWRQKRSPLRLSKEANIS